jgi:transcriptional regulator with XRE-family HTH domain
LFAARLKELRGKAQLSQTELAERSGVPVATIRGFEVGRREPTFGTLVLLARGLGVSLSAFDVEGPPEPPKRRGRKK